MGAPEGGCPPTVSGSGGLAGIRGANLYAVDGIVQPLGDITRSTAKKAQGRGLAKLVLPALNKKAPRKLYQNPKDFLVDPEKPMGMFLRKKWDGEELKILTILVTAIQIKMAIVKRKTREMSWSLMATVLQTIQKVSSQ